MCGLCGAFAGADHWSSGTGASASGAMMPAAERHARAATANAVLKLYGLTLSEWGGRFTLRSRTGKMAVVEHFGAVWPEAERMLGTGCDPLDPAFLDRLEAGRL
jgi:hypothetical protein